MEGARPGRAATSTSIVFDDVVNLITNNYVESVNVDKVMRGAMHGLAEGLDPDSAYLPPAQVKDVEGAASAPTGDVGLELTVRYYLRVVAARQLASRQGGTSSRATTSVPSTTFRRARCLSGKD